MPHEIEANWDQMHMLPPCIEDWIGPDHAARFIREFVDELDLKSLGFCCASNNLNGRPSYAVKLLLRVWLYGYFEKVHSTRQLEKACRERMGFIWLCGMHCPDHNSLWRFWNSNRKALRKLFTKSVHVAIRLKMVGFITQAIDGTKIQALSASRGCYDKESLERLFQKLNERINELEELLENPQKDARLVQSNLPTELSNKSALRERVKEALSEVEQGKARHIHPNDRESRRMGVDGRNRFAYNAQAVVDAKEQVLVGIEVVNDPNDKAQLNAMIKQADKSSGHECKSTLADAGYASGSELEQARINDKDIVMPLPAQSQNRNNNPYHASCFKYDEKNDEVICPEHQRIAFQRVRIKDGKSVRVYRNASVCKSCPARSKCTKDRHGRTIEIAPWHKCVQEHRQKMQRNDIKELYDKRAAIVEPVFGWIKHNAGLRRWSFHGLDKVRTQWAIACCACNLRKIYKHCHQSSPMAS